MDGPSWGVMIDFLACILTHLLSLGNDLPSCGFSEGNTYVRFIAPAFRGAEVRYRLHTCTHFAGSSLCGLTLLEKFGRRGRWLNSLERVRK